MHKTYIGWVHHWAYGIPNRKKTYNDGCRRSFAEGIQTPRTSLSNSCIKQWPAPIHSSKQCNKSNPIQWELTDPGPRPISPYLNQISTFTHNLKFMLRLPIPVMSARKSNFFMQTIFKYVRLCRNNNVRQTN